MKIEEHLIREMVTEDYDEVYQLWSLTKGIGLSGADTRENIDAYLKRNKGLSFFCKTGNRIIGGYYVVMMAEEVLYTIW